MLLSKEEVEILGISKGARLDKNALATLTYIARTIIQRRKPNSKPN